MRRSIVIFILCRSIFASMDNSIQFDFMSFLNGKYSLSYQRYVTEKQSLDFRIQYHNDRKGLVTYIGAPVEEIYDVSAYFSSSVYPFNGRKGLYGNIGIEVGYASITLDKETVPDVDSIYANGLFFAPTLNLGYKFLIKRRVSIIPQFGWLYNFNRIDYTGIGKWKGLSYWAIKEDFPFLLTWEQLHNIRKGFEWQLSLKAGIDF